MGIELTVRNADFSALQLGFIPPVAAAWEYINFFGSGHITRNLVLGKPACTLVGTADVATHSAVFTFGSGYLQTAVRQSSSMTIIAIGRHVSGGNSLLLSNFNGARPDGEAGMSVGVTFWFNGFDNVLKKVTPEIVIGRKAAPGGASLGETVGLPTVDAPAVNPQFYAGGYDAITNTKMLIGKTTGYAAESQMALNQDLGISPLLIGSNYKFGDVPATASKVEVYGLLICSQHLTEVEIETIYSWARGYYSRRGINI